MVRPRLKIFDLRSLAAAVVLTRTVGQRRLGLCDNRATISLAGSIACITSSFDASATRTASIWLSAGASFVRFSTQGIALSVSIDGQGAFRPPALSAFRDLPFG